MELKLDAEIDLTTGTLKGKGIGKPDKEYKPYHLTAVNTQVAVGGQPTIINLGSAPVGMLWNILGCVVVGSDDHTVVAGSTAALYKGDPSNFGLMDLLEPSTSTFGSAIPCRVTYSDELLWTHPSEDVFVVVTGAATGQNLTAVLQYDMWIGEEAQ